MPTIDTFVLKCLEQAREQYVYGAEVPLDAPLAGVQEWDCSELVQVCAHQAGGYLPDGSAMQLAYCQRQRATVSIDEGVRTRGALLFVQSPTHRHVAVSLGDGSTIEARGRAYGVNVFGARARGWTHAARVPGFTYPPPPSPGDDMFEKQDRERLEMVYAHVTGDRGDRPPASDPALLNSEVGAISAELLDLRSRVEQIARALGLPPAE